MKRLFVVLLSLLVVCALLLFAFSLRPKPTTFTYGMSFMKMYADELKLPWKEVYIAMLDDLQVRHLRLAAHWPMIEPERDRYRFDELDFQVEEARKRNATIILGVGRRLPRWPECHVPHWVGSMPWEEQKQEIRQLITETVERYKDEPSIIYWQVENEPFLEVFAHEHCGDLDQEFLAEEVALVRALDPSRPVLVTDSGNLGTWAGAYRAGDAFGTSVYVYFWNPELGQFRTILPPAFYRMKENVMAILFGRKPIFLIELSGEPWLIDPIAQVPIETQLSRMDLEKFKEIVAYARGTRLSTQYLWGVEWWYYMKERGHAEFWDYAHTLYANEI